MAKPGLFFDWDGDGFDTGTYDDCTALLTNAQYSRGGTPEITGAAQAGSATFTLLNPDGLFDPDNASGPLYGLLTDGVRVWFGMNDDGTLNDKSGTVKGRFAGRTLSISPLPQAGAGTSTPTVEILCEDALGWYGRIDVALGDDCSPVGPTGPTGACLYSPHTSGTEPAFVQQVSYPVTGAGFGQPTPIAMQFEDNGGVPPTPGNFLVLTAMPQQPGVPSPPPAVYILPPCWEEDVRGDDAAADTRLQSLMTASRVSLATDAYPIPFSVATYGGMGWYAYVTLTEYSGMGSRPTVVATDAGSLQANIGTADIPALSPSGTSVLIVANAGNEPNYPASGVSSGWTIRGQTNSGGGSRQATSFVDNIVTSPDGTPVTGTITSPGGTDTTWWITAVAYQVTA